VAVTPVVARLRSPGPTWHLRRSEVALAYGRGEFGRARRLALAACEALATLELARALGRRGRSGDRAEASALALVAADTGERLEMLPLVRDARALVEGAAAGGPLTRREGEIAGLVARGLTNRQIAAALHISERTAENHVQHILTKLGMQNPTQVAAWAAGNQLA
jgi:DNA-binding NarL/FixJ family response regulator